MIKLACYMLRVLTNTTMSYMRLDKTQVQNLPGVASVGIQSPHRKVL